MPTDGRFDVFVSYAHADNGVPLGSAVPLGWVSALASNLNEGPNVLRKRLFIDHQLRPGDNFSDDLLTTLDSSSLLVLLLSQNYIDSEWCGREVDHFIRMHADDPEKPSDIFVVELFPYERLSSVPRNLQLLRKRLIHAKFWYQRRDAAEPSLSGYPSAMESGPDGRDHYWTVLNELRVALDSRLRDMRALRRLAVGEVAPEASSRPLAARSRERSGTILLADTTDDLEAQRNAVRIALEPEGVEVLPEGDYVGLQPEEFETAVGQDLGRASLFVQLLSTTPGRKGKGFAAPLPQLQFARARQANVPILQWCERLPSAHEIADHAHARLFETEFIRATNLAEFKAIVLERIRADKALQERRRLSPGPEVQVSREHRPQIFVDDVAGDPALSDRLRAIIRKHDYTVRSLPAGAPLGNNGIDIKELLRPCRAGLTIYVDRTKYAIAYNRLVYFLNQVADGNLPLARWGVYLQQGTVASEFGIESDEVVPIDENGLTTFLDGL